LIPRDWRQHGDEAFLHQRTDAIVMMTGQVDVDMPRVCRKAHVYFIKEQVDLVN